MPTRKRIAIFVCNDLIALFLANRLVPPLTAQGWEPVLFNTEERKNRKPIHPSPPDVGFYVAGIVSNPLLPYLEKNPAPADARNYSYKQLAKKYGLEYTVIDHVNAPEIRQIIEKDPDMAGGLSLRFLQVFESPIIAAFREKGFFWNLHGGLLPAYKGLLIPYHAILNGEKEYGWTLHETTEGIDAGDIIAMDSLPLDPQKPVFEIYVAMVDKGISMIMEAIKKYQSYKHIPQAVLGIETYYSFPSAEQLARIRAMGVRYIESPEAHADFIAEEFGVSGTHAAGLRKALQAEIYAFKASFPDKLLAMTS